MKTYSIGRDNNCDIVINDKTDVVSRRHALINVYPSGKMTIIDQSSNGTYVNGIRVSPNVPVPVTRKDTVTLAHIERLDWNMVPKSNDWVKYLLIALVTLVLLNAVVVGMYYLLDDDKKCGEEVKVETVKPETAAKDTAFVKTVPEEVKKEDGNEREKVKKDNERQVNSGTDKKYKKEEEVTGQGSKESESKKQSVPKKPARVAG